MKNIGEMMRKAQEVQSRLTEMQNTLGGLEVIGQSGGGMVNVTLNGRGEAKMVKLDPKVVDPSDVGMLEDLITAAYNDAHAKVAKHVESETQKAMGGMTMPPGLKMPF